MNAAEIRQLQDYGLTIDQVRKLGTYKKGKLASIVVGTQTVNVQIPGNAKALMGMSISVDDTSNLAAIISVTVKLNNDVIIDNVDLLQFWLDYNGLQPNGYMECFRTMQGADVLELTVTSTSASATINFMFHYVGNANANWMSDV